MQKNKSFYEDLCSKINDKDNLRFRFFYFNFDFGTINKDRRKDRDLENEQNVTRMFCKVKSTTKLTPE